LTIFWSDGNNPLFVVSVKGNSVTKDVVDVVTEVDGIEVDEIEVDGIEVVFDLTAVVVFFFLFLVVVDIGSVMEIDVGCCKVVVVVVDVDGSCKVVVVVVDGSCKVVDDNNVVKTPVIVVFVVMFIF
jgi:hypothetical protein